MKFEQASLVIPTNGQKTYLVTAEVEKACPFIRAFQKGVLQVFIRHTSASLSINENSSDEVRADLTMVLNHIAPEDLPYQHTEEGPDDMPAHVKASLMGSSITIPITAGKLALGRWQGLYLCEHRCGDHSRELVCTAWGV